MISTPFFPFLYPRDYEVEFTIHCRGECQVHVNFIDFQMAPVSVLEVDYIAIYVLGGLSELVWFIIPFPFSSSWTMRGNVWTFLLACRCARESFAAKKIPLLFGLWQTEELEVDLMLKSISSHQIQQ